jgi:hypothetical protein
MLQRLPLVKVQREDGSLLLAMADALEDAQERDEAHTEAFSIGGLIYRLMGLAMILGGLWFLYRAGDALGLWAATALASLLFIAAEVRNIVKRIAERTELEREELHEIVSGEPYPAERVVRLLEALVAAEDWDEKRMIRAELAKLGVAPPLPAPGPDLGCG